MVHCDNAQPSAAGSAHGRFEVRVTANTLSQETRSSFNQCKTFDTLAIIHTSKAHAQQHGYWWSEQVRNRFGLLQTAEAQRAQQRSKRSQEGAPAVCPRPGCEHKHRYPLQSVCRRTALLAPSCVYFDTSCLCAAGPHVDEELQLRQFDLTSKYGPCVGMTRLERCGTGLLLCGASAGQSLSIRSALQCPQCFQQHKTDDIEAMGSVCHNILYRLYH